MTCWPWRTPSGRLPLPGPRRRSPSRGSGPRIRHSKPRPAPTARAADTCASCANPPEPRTGGRLGTEISVRHRRLLRRTQGAFTMPGLTMSLISPELLSVLRCPVTGSALVQEGEELIAASPGADGQTLRYAIEDGIPLLLPPELLAAASAARSDQHDGGNHDGGRSGGAPRHAAE